MKKLFFVATVCAVGGSVLAQDAAIQGFTGGSQFSSFDGTHMTVGWNFTLAEDQFVTALGFWEATGDTPLAHSHQVGIWNAGGTLVTSTTVAVDDPIIGPNPAVGAFRYHNLDSPVLLAAGTYNLGAEIMVDAVVDNYISSITGLSMLSGVTFNGARRNALGGGFSDPTTSPTTAIGRVGPNMLLTPVPEPATMLALAGGSAALLRRRRR